MRAFIQPSERMILYENGTTPDALRSIRQIRFALYTYIARIIKCGEAGRNERPSSGLSNNGFSAFLWAAWRSIRPRGSAYVVLLWDYLSRAGETSSRARARDSGKWKEAFCNVSISSPTVYDLSRLYGSVAINRTLISSCFHIALSSPSLSLSLWLFQTAGLKHTGDRSEQQVRETDCHTSLREPQRLEVLKLKCVNVYWRAKMDESSYIVHISWSIVPLPCVLYFGYIFLSFLGFRMLHVFVDFSWLPGVFESEELWFSCLFHYLMMLLMCPTVFLYSHE